MNNTPPNLKYTKDHEWIKVSCTENTATIGVTNFAQSEIGEIVYVDLPNVGRTLKAGESFSALESTKAASDVYAPVSGVVSEVNSALSTQPDLINKDPYGEGWIVKLKNVNDDEVSKLMSREEYEKLIDKK